MVDSIPPDHYAVLGLDKQATSAQIKTAYKKLALKHHPDKAKDKNTAADQFHKISQAYETLVDDEKRGKYEEQLQLARLKKDIQERRQQYGPPPSGYGGSPMGSRRPSVDVRYGYPQPRSPYTGTTPFTSQARFEERRPPRDTSREDDRASQFEESRFTARKYPPEYMRAPPSTSRPTSSRQEEIRRPSRDQPKPKTFDADKKKTGQTRKQDRFAKGRFSQYSSSDDSDSDEAYDSRGRDTDYGRKSSAPRRDRSPAAAADPYHAKFNTAREYQARSRPNPSPPRSHSPPAYRREAFQREMPPRPTVDTRGSYDSRPGMTRTTSYRHSPVESVPRSRAPSGRDAANSRRTESKAPPDDERRPVPPASMMHSMSSPPGGGQLPKMTNSDRRSTVPVNEKPPQRRAPDRANTMPMPDRTKDVRNDKYATSPTAPPRRSSEAQQGASQRPPPLHHGSSHLRQSATVPNDDSGYSTSSPSEEAPQKENIPFSQSANPNANTPGKTSKTYPYTASSNGTSMNVHVESETSSSEDEDSDDEPPKRSQPQPAARSTTADARSSRRPPAPSRSTSPPAAPPERTRANSSATRTQLHAPHTNTAERAKGPPPSSSSKFASAERDRDPYHPSKHQDSTSSSTHIHSPGEGRTRRPSLQRSNSSKGQVPTLSRSKTMPVERPRLETRSQTSANLNTKKLFGEMGDVTSSPVDLERNGKSDGEGRDSGRDSGRERAGDSGRERGGDSGRERTSDKDRERRREKEGRREKRSHDERRTYEDKTRSARETISRTNAQQSKRSPRMPSIFG